MVARKWGYLISTTAYLPHTPEEIERELAGLAGRLFDAVASDPPGPLVAGPLSERTCCRARRSRSCRTACLPEYACRPFRERQRPTYGQ